MLKRQKADEEKAAKAAAKVRLFRSEGRVLKFKDESVEALLCFFLFFQKTLLFFLLATDDKNFKFVFLLFCAIWLPQMLLLLERRSTDLE